MRTAKDQLGAMLVVCEATGAYERHIRHAQRKETWPERMRRFQPSVGDYYQRMSAGKFRWTRVGFAGPLTISPSKPFGPLSGPPGAGQMAGGEIARRAVTTAATQGHVDFRSFDTNHDGKISDKELDILIIVSGSNTSGHAGWFGAGGVPIPGQNVTCMGRKAAAGENGARQAGLSL